MKSEENSAKILQMARVIHFAFIMSLVVYGAVVWIFSKLRHPPSNKPFEKPDQLRYLFYAAVVLIILVVRKIRPMLKKRFSFLQRAIIKAAFCEVPALLGLVYFFLTASNRDFIYLTIISLVLLFMHYPRFDPDGSLM